MYKTGDKVEKVVDNKIVSGFVQMHEEHDGPAQSIVVRWNNNTTVYETAENIRPCRPENKESGMFNALNKHEFSVGHKVEKWIRTNQGTTDLAAGVVIAVEREHVFVKWDNLDGNFIEKWELPVNIQLRDWNTRLEENQEATTRVYKYYDNLTCTIRRAFWDKSSSSIIERHEVLTLELSLSDGFSVLRPAKDLMELNGTTEIIGTIKALAPNIWEV